LEVSSHIVATTHGNPQGPSIMAAAKKSSSGVIAVRSKQLLITAPGTMGFSNLLEPDDAFDALKFNVQIHYNEDQQARLVAQIGQGIEENWTAFLKEVSDKPEPKGGWQIPDAEGWVRDHLKEPSERSRTQQPSIQWANDAEFRNKDGQLQRKTMRAYDASGKLIDLPSLRLGMGSIVQAVLIPGLFISGLVKQPAPSFKLQGVKVLKLVQYGGGGGSLGDVSEEDMALLGDDVEVDDLGSYAKKDDAPKGKPARAPSDFDLDDEIPF
jgi:hypothetical protein